MGQKCPPLHGKGRRERERPRQRLEGGLGPLFCVLKCIQGLQSGWKIRTFKIRKGYQNGKPWLNFPTSSRNPCWSRNPCSSRNPHVSRNPSSIRNSYFFKSSTHSFLFCSKRLQFASSCTLWLYNLKTHKSDFKH